MYDQITNTLKDIAHIVVVQAENPDGDSLGSALALEEILSELGKKVSLYCAVDMPKHLRHLKGWDRVTNEFPLKADAAIIVDTVSDTLLSKALHAPAARHFFETHPVIVFDHHAAAEDNLPFPHELIADGSAVATGQLIARIADDLHWPVGPQAAAALYVAIMADSLGLTTPNTTAESFRTIARLIDQGAVPFEIENERRKFMKKPAEILEYKGRLLQRIEYLLEGELALIHIPWEEIEQYSDRYNPSVLVLDEMRLVEGVQLAIAIKTYPDGRLTAKLRANPEAKIADTVAGYFGGGGHGYAAGFRVYENLDTIKRELVEAVGKALKDIKDELET